MNSARVSRSESAISRRMPCAGKLRSGIKVLTRAAEGVEGLKQIYADGVAIGASFDDIAKSMSRVQGAPKYPLTPRNAGYFSVRQCDFAIDGAAMRIMDLYGEVRPGDTERRLYALPIIFPSDDVDLIFREQFEAWKASELVRWSEQDPRTGKLQCMKRADVAPDKSSRRRWGGRPSVAERACDPNDCDLFGKGECKHTATLAFWVPGISGAGVIELGFTSIYASMNVMATLDAVRAGLGRVSGLYHGEPIFWLSKTRERVAKMNWESGKPEKVDQWIIRLEAKGLDMVKALTGTDAQCALPAPARTLALEEPAPPDSDSEPEPNDGLVRELRAQVSALRDTMGWDSTTLREWIDDREYATSSPAKDPDCLADMVTRLTELAKIAAARTSEEVPF